MQRFFDISFESSSFAGIYTELEFILLSFLAYIPLIWSIFRMYSRNIEARRRENAAFLRFFSRLTDKQYRYFRCPGCRQVVRVPRGKGKINIRCPKCSRQFIKKT